MKIMIASASLLLPLFSASLGAQSTTKPRAEECSSCAEWNAPHAPFRIFGNTYYVGTNGLSAILVTNPQGHILLDGALPESAPQVIANIRSLGFLVEDIRLIVNSHAHFDHAGGIAELQRASGARVAATAASVKVIESGTSGADDPQFGVLLPYAPVANVQTVTDGETLRVGPLAVTAHLTAGHTKGGTTWSWTSCESARCLAMVYADSQTPVSADGFLYTNNRTYPNAIADFAHGASVLESLPCDVLLTPHPGASAMFSRIGPLAAGSDVTVDTNGCKAYAATARAAVAKRIATENAKH
jgi:metallo-beta-lactamase class B